MAENSTVLKDPLRQKLVDILHSDGVKDEVDKVIKTEPPELKGEHFATATVYIRYEFVDTSIQPRNLFLKKFTSNEAHSAFIRQGRIMEKETSFFMDFLPKAKAFCGKYKGCGNLLDIFPKCLYADEDMVVLENVVLDDTFIMLNKDDKQDLYTAKMVLANLAKFHAAGYAYIQMECGGSEKFQEVHECQCFEAFIQENNPMMEPMFDNGTTTCINILKNHPVEGSDEVIASLANTLGKTYPIICSLIKPNHADPLLVLTHGDCHNNNMLFKKDPTTGKVTQHMFVDLQITRFGSPNLDIGYFLYTSVKPGIRRAHLTELLRHYYDTFEKTVGSFGLKCPMSFEEFVDDYGEKSQLGFNINLAFMSAIGAMKDLDMETMSNDPAEMTEMMNKAIAKWIFDNPDKAAAIAEETVAVVKENAKIRGETVITA